MFLYEDLNLENENLVYATNINQITGIQLKDIKAIGKIRIDAVILLNEIELACKAENKNFKYSIMEKLTLPDKSEAIVPIFLTIENKKYPTYFIFNQTHKAQFSKVKNTLYKQGFKDCIYFSAISM